MLNVNFWNIAFTIINILVLYAFMRHFLVKPVRQILEQRREAVERDLDDASASKQEAERLRVQYESSLQSAHDEAAKIVEDARTRGQGEYERILDQAKADADKKVKDAERTISLEQEKAMKDLSASVAGLAMTAAAKLLAQQSGPERDKSLYDSFLKEAGEKRHD